MENQTNTRWSTTCRNEKDILKSTPIHAIRRTYTRTKYTSFQKENHKFWTKEWIGQNTTRAQSSYLTKDKKTQTKITSFQEENHKLGNEKSTYQKTKYRCSD